MDRIFNPKRFRANDYNDINTITYSTTLPDELWLLVLSYMNIVDIFQSFHGLNQRFQGLTYECATNIILPSYVTSVWLDQHLPRLEYRIKTICLNDKFLQCIFSNTWSFPNLQFIILQGNRWSMSLIVQEKPASVVINSSLNLLQQINVQMNGFYIDKKSFISNIKYVGFKSSCPFIKRLSINKCCISDLFILNACTSNLIDLKVNRLYSEQRSNDCLNKTTTGLVKLDITTSKDMNFNLLEQLISTYQTSLKKLKLHVHCLQPIDGYRLESLFKSCEQLTKLDFLFEYKNQEGNTDDFQRSFQSKWWLDTRRPLVYIQYNDIGDKMIASMPCQFPCIFKGDPFNNRHFNKNRTSSVRFTGTNNIHISNDIHQPIGLEYLYAIDRMFTSSNQRICFDFGHLELVDILFDIIIEDTSMPPVLPNVNHFIIGSDNKIDSLTLSVWILLTANLRKLDISNLMTFNKIELAKELSDMIDNDQRLKSNFDGIEKLCIFKQCDEDDIVTKHELSVAFSKVFINSTICESGEL